MSTLVIISWVLVLVLTVINVLVFLKLKQASEQMMKMAFPGARNMNEALAKMQQMMGAMGAMGGRGGMGGGRPGGPNMNAQMKAAMDMLQKMQQQKKKR